MCVAADIWRLQPFFSVLWGTDEDDNVDVIQLRCNAVAYVGLTMAACCQLSGTAVAIWATHTIARHVAYMLGGERVFDAYPNVRGLL